jgi:hypothetical protein
MHWFVELLLISNISLLFRIIFFSHYLASLILLSTIAAATAAAAG